MYKVFVSILLLCSVQLSLATHIVFYNDCDEKVYLTQRPNDEGITGLLGIIHPGYSLLQVYTDKPKLTFKNKYDNDVTTANFVIRNGSFDDYYIDTSVGFDLPIQINSTSGPTLTCRDRKCRDAKNNGGPIRRAIRSNFSVTFCPADVEYPSTVKISTTVLSTERPSTIKPTINATSTTIKTTSKPTIKTTAITSPIKTTIKTTSKPTIKTTAITSPINATSTTIKFNNNCEFTIYLTEKTPDSGMENICILPPGHHCTSQFNSTSFPVNFRHGYEDDSTLASFDLNQDSLDWYNIQLQNGGFNVPLQISPQDGHTITCADSGCYDSLTHDTNNNYNVNTGGVFSVNFCPYGISDADVEENTDDVI